MSAPISTSAERKGKVKKIVCHPLKDNLVAVATKEHIIICNMAKGAEHSTVQLPSRILDCRWSQGTGISYLVALCEEGDQFVYKLSSSNTLILQTPLSSRIHIASAASGSEVVKGTLSCRGKLVASSLGHGVITQTIYSDGCSYFNHSDTSIFTDSEEFSGMHGSITHVEILDDSRLLVFSRQGRAIVDYDLEGQRPTKIFDIDFYSCYVSFCAERNVLLILDPRCGMQYIDTCTKLKLVTQGFPKITCSKKRAHCNIAVSKPGTSIVLGDEGILSHFNDRDCGGPSTEAKLDLSCDRIYALDISSASTLVVAFKPLSTTDDSPPTWSIATWNLSNAAGHEGDATRCKPPPSKRPKITHVVPDGDYPVQTGKCTDRQGYKLCLSCMHADSSRDECRFVGFRVLEQHGDDTPKSFAIRQDNEPLFCLAYHDPVVPPSDMCLAEVKRVAASVLLPIFKAEALRLGESDLPVRPFVLGISNGCDICSRVLFMQASFCMYCGFEICHTCLAALPASGAGPNSCPGRHARAASFAPVSFFTKAEIAQEIEMMEAALSTLPPRIQTNNDPVTPTTPVFVFPQELSSSPLPQISITEFDDDSFESMWLKTKPFVVSGVTEALNPDAIFTLTKDSEHPCTVKEYQGDDVWGSMDSTLEIYFASWDREHLWPRQVRDYPKDARLADIHPDLNVRFTDLLCKIAAPYLSPRGPYNLASYFPKGSNVPDLGPKVYISQKAGGGHGTTHLHLDKCGAVNIMLYSSDSSETNPQGALWEIWPRRAVPILSRCLDAEGTQPDYQDGFPIMSEKYFINDEVINDAKRHGCPPRWVYNQLPGDCVVIPPGCPHQVTNLSNCVKIAVDFVCPFDIHAVQNLRERFFRYNVKAGYPARDDLLRLEEMLWYAWKGT